MNCHLKNLLLWTTLFTIVNYSAQVPKRVVVEHFTNSVCGTCASRNPGFFSNLDAQDSVLHIAFHPSAPYANCAFNNHNVSDNDGRTNYYGIYGLTPRLVIQGTPISAVANYNDASIFSPFLNQTSPVSIKVQQFKVGDDSVRCRVVVKTESTHTLPALKLFVALVENPVLYAAPNGENTHRNVFRKAVTTIDGNTFNAATNIGDSIVFVKTLAISNVWIFNSVYTMAILQESVSKATVQANFSSPGDGTPMSIQKNIQKSPFTLFPNPANSVLTIKNNSSESANVTIYNSFGSIVYEDIVRDQLKLNVSEFTAGLYIAKVSAGTSDKIFKFVKYN